MIILSEDSMHVVKTYHNLKIPRLQLHVFSLLPVTYKVELVLEDVSLHIGKIPFFDIDLQVGNFGRLWLLFVIFCVIPLFLRTILEHC